MKAALRLALALCTLQGTSALSLSYTEKLKLAEDIVKHSGNGPADPAFHSAIGRVYRATESSPNERAMVLDLAADRIPLHRSKQYAAVSKYLQGYALGLWEGRIGAKNKGDFTQSEFLRRGHFLTDDQAEWNRRSNIAIAQIGKMLRENKSLYDIYEYARNERNQIAIAQKTVGAIEFGEIREGFGRDLYQKGALSGAEADPTIYEQIVLLLTKEIDAFSRSELSQDLASDDDGYYRPKPGKVEISQYTYAPETSEGFDIVFFIEHDVHGNKDKEPRSIRVRWPKMSEKTYKEQLTILGGAIPKILDKTLHGEAALYEIGLLVHALCQSIFLKRGSAAVNGWIMKALCKEKEYPIANLRIEGLPFDIYAQFQLDKSKFAKAFVKAVIASKAAA